MRLLLLAVWGLARLLDGCSTRAKATQWREPLAGCWLHRTLTLIGMIVLALRATPAILFRYIRHPIHVGILLPLLGSAIGLDRWSTLLGFVLILSSLWRKARREECHLCQGPAGLPLLCQ